MSAWAGLPRTKQKTVLARLRTRADQYHAAFGYIDAWVLRRLDRTATWYPDAVALVLKHYPRQRRRGLKGREQDLVQFNAMRRMASEMLW